MFTRGEAVNLVIAASLVQWIWWRWRFERSQAHWREYVATLEHQHALEPLEHDAGDGGP
jgi:hypothetical protein